MLEEEKGEKKVLFATFDPRVIHMLHTHRKDIAARLAQPMVAWFYWDDQLLLRRIEGADNTRPKIAVQSVLSFSGEDAARFDEALQAGFIQASLMERFADRESQFLELLPPHLRYRLVGELLERAKQLKITDGQDRVLFCATGLFKHLKPEILAGLGDGETTLSSQGLAKLRALSVSDDAMLSDEIKREGAALIRERLTAFSEELKAGLRDAV